MGTTNQTIDSLTCGMTTSLIPVGIPCPVADGCKSIANNVTCPIKANTTVVYNIDIDVKSLYPQMQLYGNIHLKLSDKTDAICMQLPIDILPAPQPPTTTKAPVTTKTTAAPTTASTSGSSVTRPVALLLAAMASAFL